MKQHDLAARIENETCTARAFAKLIISGEHAILYSQPALGISVTRFVEISLVEQKGTESFVFDLQNLGVVKTLSYEQLEDLLSRKILQNSSELVPYALIKLITAFKPQIFSGMKICVTSNIPVGCGLGSSAAVIVSLIHAFNYFFKLNIKIEDYLQIGKEIEDIQHGKSSGFDIYLALWGGGAKFISGKISPRNFYNLPMYYINTGSPKSTTSDCVKFVAQYFQEGTLADRFGAITNKLDDAWQERNLENIKKYISLNHRLLVDIGVVPKKVQNFIDEIERNGGAAKICGAGTVEGENAGMIIAITENNINDLLSRYGYERLIMNFNNNRVEIVEALN